MIKAMKFVGVPVGDQQRALEFYTQKLGFRVITDQPFDDRQRWIELSVGDSATRVVLFVPGEGLYVTDIGGCVLRIVAGDAAWPPELVVRQALGPELTRGRMGDLQRAVDAALGGAAAVPLWLRGRAVAVLICERRPDQALEWGIAAEGSRLQVRPDLPGRVQHVGERRLLQLHR